MSTIEADQLDVLLSPDDLRSVLERDALRGLTASPKWLPPKYFYDDRGSELFEQITRLPEYYPTRAEHGILQSHAGEIATAAGCETLLELGSGSSTKTRLLLDALRDAGDLRGYVPVDVSAGALSESMPALKQEYPGMEIRGVIADFDAHLGALPLPGRRLWALLGGTIGNYPPAERAQFLSAIASAMQPGEAFLVGLDLVKEPGRLMRAYDDAAGVTAAFNLNVLSVLNRELDGDLDPSDFEHVAIWDDVNEWIEMRLRARGPVHARLGVLDLEVVFDGGEELRTEISAKFRREPIEAELRVAGMEPTHWWTDGDFALALARKEN
ncbi:L-histidine N(alpha)-methyltransferase [Nocardioides baekrokdamisoli]|nr:L-histidine N(alpha)-methyltransferase [Nocardioides baekrokdamisoli]